MKTYCNGKWCSKRNECARHATVMREEGLFQNVDWSTFSRGLTYTDYYGKTHTEICVYCGDDGDFKMFMKIENTKENNT